MQKSFKSMKSVHSHKEMRCYGNVNSNRSSHNVIKNSQLCARHTWLTRNLHAQAIATTRSCLASHLESQLPADLRGQVLYKLHAASMYTLYILSVQCINFACKNRLLHVLKKMGRISVETRRRVVLLKNSGYTMKEIRERLLEEDISISLVSLFRLLKKYNEHGTIRDLPRPPPITRLNREQVQYVDCCMAGNDELTARQLHALLLKEWPDLNVSLSTIKKERRNLGWVSTRPKYCQLVRERNKEKRVEWCNEMINSNETFENVIFTDECSIQLDHHGRLCFRKRGQPRQLKPKPKHPIKVHVWAGISNKGMTHICIFTGIMTATRYCIILEKTLKPFVDAVFPDGNYRFQQDNDPKHTSKYAQQYYLENDINWWKTPAESPDLNPIENVWASLKYYLRYNYKPTNMATLESGIKEFWKMMTPELCSRYIAHLHKVMPKVIQVNGAATGF